MSQKNTDYLILINGENKLPENYYDTVELIPVENCFGHKHIAEKKAYEAFLKLREALLEEDNIHTEIFSVYRSIEHQTEVFNDYLEKRGEEYTYRYIAKPWHSEHHTGLAFDISIVKDGKLCFGIENLLAINDLFQIVHKKAPEYGFILRYPDGKEDITKIAYETWHFRYVGSPEIASEITEKGICFEEYWQKLNF